MGKNISLIGNPGTGKTTFLVGSIHRLSEIGWVKINPKKLPKDYGLWVDQLISGGVLPPTVKDHEYPMQFTKTIRYKQSEVKLSRLGGVTFRVRDLRGEDYRRTTELFKQSVRDAAAVIVTIDASKSTDLGQALGGQVQPLIDGIRHMIEKEKGLKYLGLVFTKRSFHNHPIRKIREFVHTPLGPILRYLEDKKIAFRVLECDTRGVDNRFKPWGLEEIYYDVLSHLGKVSGARLDVTTDPDHVWIDTRPVVTTPPPTSTPSAPTPITSPTPTGTPISKSKRTDKQKGLGQGAKPKDVTPSAPQPETTAPTTGVMYLVICPACAYKNPQGLTKCENCGGPI